MAISIQIYGYRLTGADNFTEAQRKCNAFLAAGYRNLTVIVWDLQRLKKWEYIPAQLDLLVESEA